MINRILLLVLVIGYSMRVAAQNRIDSLFTSVSQRFSSYPSELVYLQTSKEIYETGEDLWFKAYQLDAKSFGLSTRSKTLYLQMLSDKDSVVWQEKYPIENGIADGHIYVDTKLPEGSYRLEAYTRHSYYKDTVGISPVRKIKVLKNISYNTPAKEGEETGDLRFELFPEGGNLVSGLPFCLAFKATDTKGYPVDVEGVLCEGGLPLMPFKSSHDGMGKLLFTPFADKEYRIELKDGHSYLLPEVYKQGVALRLLKQDQEQLEFIIPQTQDLPDQEVCLVGQMRGMVCCVAKGMLKDRLKIKMPLVEFPYQGIVEFTLFDNAMKPVAERLVYVHPEKKLHIRIVPEKESYALREKAALHIKVTDDKNRPVKVNLGISVFDKAYSNPVDPVNILTHCYLSSQIRGVVHRPSYYFDEKNNDRVQAMDLLLLTQGWRRYIWEFNGPVYQGEAFLSDDISGVQVTGGRKKSREKQEDKQLVQVTGAEGNSAFLWTDSVGHFTIDTDRMKELRGGYIYLKPMLSKEFKPELEIVDYFPVIDSVRREKYPGHSVTVRTQAVKEESVDMPVVSSDSIILLDEVVVSRKARRPFRDKFMGRLDSMTQMSMENVYVCGCGYLQNYKPGYDAHPWWKPCGEPSDKRTKPVEGKQYEIVKFKHLGGNAFSVIDRQTVTYHGPIYSEKELLRMNNLWRTKGYYALREFYQPDEVDMQLPIPDARNTLFWSPMVVTDEKGEATVSFYCSDINTGFIGMAEGVDGTGLLGSDKCEFRVIRKAN